MRQTRRGCFAARKEPKYVWAVYAVETGYGADETTAPYTGSFTLSSSTRYKMAASSYTATATQFTLTNPVQKTRSQLAVGDYLVNVSTSSSTAVTGGYLYKITSISGNTFAYTRWQPAAYQRKTGAELYRVSSDTQDYPVDGAQDGYWYVMLKGYRTMYVWDVFNIRQYYEMRNEGKEYILGYETVYLYDYSFSSITGLFTITSYRGTDESYKVNSNGTREPDMIPINYNWLPEKLNIGDTSNIMYKGSSYSSTMNKHASLYEYIGVLTGAKGSATGQTVESESQDAYPQDGINGDKWYTYLHSYSKPFDNR